MRPRAPGKPERFCGLMGMHRYSRRQLIQGGLALAGFSLLSGCEMPGQQAAKVRRIGFLAVGSREGRAFLIEGLLQGLREHGYVEGQNIVIEYRFSEAAMIGCLISRPS